MIVNLNGQAETSKNILAEIREKVDNILGVAIAFTQPLQMKDELM